MTIDPHVYPVASEDIAFDSPVLVKGGAAWAASKKTANGVSVGPNFRGEATHYQLGQTMRVRMNGDDE